MRIVRLGWTAVTTGLLVASSPAAGQFNLSVHRAADGTVYQAIVVPTPLTGGAEQVRVTTVAGSVQGVQSCSVTGGTPGMTVATVAGVDTFVGSLHPISQVLRTNVLTPSGSAIGFSAGGSGKLLVGAVEVCANPADCSGGDPDASVYDLDGNVLTSGAIAGDPVPVACTAASVTAPCSSGNFSAFGFGLSRDVNTKTCNVQPTTTGTVCGPTPVDGFALQPGQVVVFMYQGGLVNTGFSVGAAGFRIDTNGANDPNCSPNTVIGADGQNQSAPPPPPPTPTPTRTATPSPTATPTPTCDDNNECTTDSWDGTQCVHQVVPDGTSCSDGNACTQGDQCQAGSCQGGIAVNCDDGNECTADSCSPSLGCVYNPRPAQTPCTDDGMVCTEDVCDGSGHCVHVDMSAADCPKGYAVLEVPSAAEGTLVARRISQVTGSACVENARLGRSATIQGDLLAGAATGTAIRVGREAQVTGVCVTGGGQIAIGRSGQCVSGQGRPDSYGALLSSCVDAADLADTRVGALLGLAASQTFGAVTISSDDTLDVTSHGSVPVIQYASLRLKRDRTLTIQGNSSTEAIIIRVAGDLNLGRGAKILGAGMSGNPAERILYLVGDSIVVRKNGIVHGTLFGQKRVLVGWNASVEGALLSTKQIEVGRTARLNHVPWRLW